MKNRLDVTSEQLIMSGVLRLGRRLRAARPADAVPISQLSALEILVRLGPMPAARLAEEMRLQPQSLSRLIVALEDSGLIERTPGREDRRTILLSITLAGRAAVAYDFDARYAWLEAQMKDRLNADEKQALARAAAIMLKLAS